MKTPFPNTKRKASKVSEAVLKYKEWEKTARLKTGKENKILNDELRKEAIRKIAAKYCVSSELMIKILIS